MFFGLVALYSRTVCTNYQKHPRSWPTSPLHNIEMLDSSFNLNADLVALLVDSMWWIEPIISSWPKVLCGSSGQYHLLWIILQLPISPLISDPSPGIVVEGKEIHPLFFSGCCHPSSLL
eukprot:TRINITY_DN2365_c0_g1_i1.p3 TRINITY_DN2365_c0_g1~~TRINITY_DN2365_c0_g1_i1.p3  ORF type:complete len:119 (+),score=9.67 TRINITY_DN2365_c0_g1_i1:317-673(+)